MVKMKKKISALFNEISNLDYNGKVESYAFISHLIKEKLETADEAFVGEILNKAIEFHEKD